MEDIIPAKRLVILGAGGKMSLALQRILASDWTIDVLGSADFDAMTVEKVEAILEALRPDVIFNAVAFTGIAPCADDSERAYGVNAFFPQRLATIANRLKSVLVHFSSNAIFDSAKTTPYVESDDPKPTHVYGYSKYLGDLFVATLAERYYLLRVPILFGPSLHANQFVEKMLAKIEAGETALRVATDVISTPSYTLDIARKVQYMLENEMPYGLYHVSNEGEASLYDLISELVSTLGIDNVSVRPARHTDFPAPGGINLYSPLASEKLPPLRPWQEAIADYAAGLELTTLNASSKKRVV